MNPKNEFVLIVGINYELFNCKSGVINNYHCSLSVYKYICKQSTGHTFS